MSQVAIADVVANTRLLYNQTVELLKASVLTALSTGGNITENVELAFQNMCDPFRDIATNYQFEKFCVDHLGCLVSVYSTYAVKVRVAIAVHLSVYLYMTLCNVLWYMYMYIYYYCRFLF